MRAFESDSGIALRYGSPQLAALDPWPKGIHVDALAGDTSFETPKAGWFNWPWATDKVTGAGDMIVTKGSAFAGAVTTKSINCDYQLNAIRAGTDRLGLRVGLTAASEVAQLPLGSFSGACFHRSLMRSIELTNEAVGAIREDLAARVETVHFIRAPIKTVTVNSVDYTGQTSDRVYRVSLWATTRTKKCAATATGEVAAYLASHYCREVRRNLATTTVNGRRVLIAQSYAFFGNPPDWNGDPGSSGPPSYGYVSGFVKLVARDGTGHIRSLLDDGYRFANSGTATRYPNAFDTEGEDSGAETAEVWYADGNTSDNDPDLTRLAKAVFLNLFD
jgi:hypothetical protein